MSAGSHVLNGSPLNVGQDVGFPFMKECARLPHSTRKGNPKNRFIDLPVSPDSPQATVQQRIAAAFNA